MFFAGWSLEEICNEMKMRQGSLQTPKPCEISFWNAMNYPGPPQHAPCLQEDLTNSFTPNLHLPRSQRTPENDHFVFDDAGGVSGHGRGAMGGDDAVPPGGRGRKKIHILEKTKAPDDQQKEQSQGTAKSSGTRYRGKPQGKPPKSQIIAKLIRNTNVLNIFKA